MAKITLAWPWTGKVLGGKVERLHKVDEEVNVEDHVARDLVRRGLARRSSSPEPKAKATQTQAATSATSDAAPAAGKEA